MLEIVLPDGFDDARYAIRIGCRAGYARFELQAACAVVDAYPVNRMAAELIVGMPNSLRCTAGSRTERMSSGRTPSDWAIPTAVPGTDVLPA
ncbi:hypothetical protein WS64_30020 [Burkholderia anthina]|uniref:Uncharacterized protein n=1 Tax=Burkholderia anthina TaxID=179879 RepID=A0AAW3PPH2_9BURK|nr:hypothetical protein WS64_30020 [Burkholderia anthina]